MTSAVHAAGRTLPPAAATAIVAGLFADDVGRTEGLRRVLLDVGASVRFKEVPSGRLGPFCYSEYEPQRPPRLNASS